MKILNSILALLFASFAWLQRNDIDPAIYYEPSTLDSILWLIFYLIIAIGFIVLLFRKLPKWYFIVSITACIIEMAISGPGLYKNIFGDAPFTITQQSMQASDPRVELTREFFGAVIALLGVILQAWQNKAKK